MADIAKARAMRKTMTAAEVRLWLALRVLRKEGLTFRRQHPLRGFFLDFVCLDRRVIVEVDGTSHDTAERRHRDQVRDAILARDGFQTLRFENAVVLADTAGVVRDVVTRCRARPARLSRSDSPPPPAGEGRG